MTTHSCSDLAAAFMANLDKPPLVKRSGDGYVFLAEGGAGWDYDISDAACLDAGSALRWIEHMAPKAWVTVEHLEQFARLAAEHFKAPY